MHRVALSFAFIGLSASLMILGCGTDTKTQTTTGTPAQGIPLDKVSNEFAKRFCGLVFSCCDMTELADAFQGINPAPTNEAECVTAIEPKADGEIFAELKAAVAAGRLAYDEDQASACFAKVDGQCSSFKQNIFGNDETCNTVFTGKVATGGECSQSIECAQAESTCSGAMDPMLGKCAVLPKENEPCPDFSCASGLTCSSDAMPVCIKPKADGTACASDFDCASEYCDSTAMKCSAKKAIGEACDSPFACKEGYCDFTANMCTAKKDIGAPCTSFDECASDTCDTTTSKCAAPQCDGK